MRKIKRPAIPLLQGSDQGETGVAVGITCSRIWATSLDIGYKLKLKVFLSDEFWTVLSKEWFQIHFYPQVDCLVLRRAKTSKTMFCSPQPAQPV